MSNTSAAPAATDVNPMEALLGKSLVVNNELETKRTRQLMEGKELVALYFSASWCPPCKAFTPKLIEFYEQLNQKSSRNKGKFEIVYVSSDKNLDEFQSYYGKMPWLAVPTDASSAQIKNRLATSFKIRGIPALVVLDCKTGNFVTDGARNQVASAGGTATGADVVYRQWKEQPAVPIEQASLGAGAGGGLLGDTWLGKLVAYILKNPVYIIAIIYFYRIFMKHMQQQKDGGPGGSFMDDENGSGQQVPPPADEPEF